MFLSRNKKNNVYPCKPQFYYIKVGFKEVKIILACFRDVRPTGNQVIADSTSAGSATFFRHYENTPINFDPLKPHFYIVKLGFTRVYIIFLISAQNIDCGYSLEPPRRGGSNEDPQSMF